MRTPVAPARRAASFVAGLTMVAVGQWRFANGQSGGWAFACWIVGLVVCVGAVGLPGGGAPDDARVRAAASTDPPRTGWASVRTLVPVAVSFGLGAFVWWQEWTRRNDAGRWDLLALWAASVLCLAAAMWQPSWVAIRSVSWRRWLGEHRTDVLTSVWLLIGALTLHVARLGSFPYVFNGDEGGFAVLSRDAFERSGFDPFAIGFMSHPQMYNVFQAGSMEVFGTDVTGARMVSAVLGSLAVPLMYLVGTRVVGSRRAGVIAAVLLLTLPVHLFWSRSALPNGASVFFA
ncbi:MAG: glycosyltransferase family 39 protein, partial [Ilumatobacteraceae bacterium]